MPSSQNHYEAITKRIVSLLESHLAGWNKPWVYLGKDRKRAHNLVSGATYRGVNQLLLSLTAIEKECPFNQWLTFHQAKRVRATIRKGEKATRVYFFDILYLGQEKNKRYRRAEYEKLSIEAKKSVRRIPFLKHFNVFNRAQVDGLPEVSSNEEPPSTKPLLNDRAEAYISESGATITRESVDEAYYSLRDDRIVLPKRPFFKNSEGYYATAFHELGHWTGHPSRLDRKLGFPRDSPEYAFEELVAELATAYVCAELGYEKEICQNAAYIKSWLRHLSSDTTFIWRAARSAEEAAKYIMTPREFVEPG